MWKLEIYNGTQDLEQWFQDAAAKDYVNNSSKKMLLDYLQNEENTTLFLLYNNNRIVGNFVTHRLRSLGILGANAHRIAARMCVINDHIQGPRKIAGLRSMNAQNCHDHINHQFLYSVGLRYLGLPRGCYIFPGLGIGSDARRRARGRRPRDAPRWGYGTARPCWRTGGPSRACGTGAPPGADARRPRRA